MSGTMETDSGTPESWAAYYHCTAKRPPRDLLLQVLNHIEWERKARRGNTAIELGFGAGTDTLELLRRKWKVLAIDRQFAAARFLQSRVLPPYRNSLACLVAPMEDLNLPSADLIYASYSLPFCSPQKFPALWSTIRKAVRPGGHFAGQLFGDRDEWKGKRPMSFHSMEQVRRLSRGFNVELLRESVEETLSFGGPKHWHFFDLILGKPPSSSHVYRRRLGGRSSIRS
jgi:tellurite methyltransferase